MKERDKAQVVGGERNIGRIGTLTSRGVLSREWLVRFPEGDSAWHYDQELDPLAHPLEVFTAGAFKGIWPTDEDVGRGVVYTAHEAAKPEDGVVTSFNDVFVFVRYGADKGSKATRPQDLQWLSGEDR